ncbi:MAG: histidine kinase [Spirochaetaceae bacterium]|nr:histidine kinase [Spirochaetaceae bacterium]
MKNKKNCVGMKGIKRFFAVFRNQPIRRKIMITFLVSCLIIASTVLFMANIVTNTMQTIGSSYQSNADLDRYLTQLSGMEAAMEMYIRYRTFESVDRYYHYLAIVETMAETLSSSPSELLPLQREYNIRQLSENFCRYSGLAVAARRANNSADLDDYYNMTLQCYSFLTEEIMNLNMLYFKTNAENYEKNQELTRTLTSISLILMFVLFFTAVMFLYVSIKQITAPLKNISDVAQRVADRDFDVPLFNSRSKDEIGNICRAFDSMIISIRAYIDTIWDKAMKENELREKELEIRALYTDAHLKALQDQVKPHFLFNTLNTGAGLAMVEGAEKTCLFLEQVADFLRYIIQHPGRDATIGDELKMVDNYIYIMKVRFNNRYDFVKEIDEGTLSHRMPNMILQPLVDNCIRHGLKDITEGGRIVIQVRREGDNIIIAISDNGCGFSEEVKEKIFAAAENGGGVVVNPEEPSREEHISTGLVNVIARMKYYFSRDDVFSIIPNPDGKGTMFYMKIPNV